MLKYVVFTSVLYLGLGLEFKPIPSDTHMSDMVVRLVKTMNDNMDKYNTDLNKKMDALLQQKIQELEKKDQERERKYQEKIEELERIDKERDEKMYNYERKVDDIILEFYQQLYIQENSYILTKSH